MSIIIYKKTKKQNSKVLAQVKKLSYCYYVADKLPGLNCIITHTKNNLFSTIYRNGAVLFKRSSGRLQVGKSLKSFIHRNTFEALGLLTGVFLKRKGFRILNRVFLNISYKNKSLRAFFSGFAAATKQNKVSINFLVDIKKKPHSLGPRKKAIRSI